ncbi:Cysteine-rich receptor-like protein, partial [Drosera capensis]
DADMLPKISDFGTARLVGMDESFNQTQLVAGTLASCSIYKSSALWLADYVLPVTLISHDSGYMAPEYLLEGQFSVKSDVYSFGVLTLEIISGRKVRSFDQAGIAQSLLNDAWNHWNEGRELKFMDETLSTSENSSNEVKKCIQLGLLCVQPDIDKRPTMATVVYTLNNLSISTVREPQQPIHFSAMVAESSSSSVRKGIQSLSSLYTVPR